MSRTGATPRIFLVEQSNLNRSSVKARAEVFQADFLHLTNNKGLGFYNTNIINAINECYPDTKDLKNNNNYSEDISKTKDQPLNVVVETGGLGIIKVIEVWVMDLPV